MNFCLNILTSLIIQRYFSNRCLLIFTDEFNALDISGDVPLVQVAINNGDIQQDLVFHYFGCQGLIIRTNTPVSTLKMLESLIKLNMERFNDRRYLILPGNHLNESLSDIFEIEDVSYISDLVVVEEHNVSLNADGSKQTFLDEEKLVYNLWTHRYVGKNSNERVLLDVWFSGTRMFKNNTNLYPNKLLNQIGRELRMATFQYKPYSIIGSSLQTLKGSEMSTAIAFSKQYNMTPVLVVNPEDYWGEIFKNWTGNGLLGNLVSDTADIGFCFHLPMHYIYERLFVLAALYTWEATYHFLDLSKPLVRTGITCLVPAPKLAPGWLTPLYSYSPEMWTAVGILFFTCILILFFLHHFSYKMPDKKMSSSKKDLQNLFGTSVFSIIKLFVLQVVTKEEIPRGFNGTYFMGLLFLFSLFLTSTYSSGLSSIMTIPRYENPINTVEEFADSGLRWGATQEAWISSIQNAEEPMYKEIVKRFTATTEEQLREFSKTGEFAFSLERLPHENFAIGSYIRDDVIGNFHLMEKDFYWEQCVFMTRKSSVLLPLLDDFVLRVFESGLIGYWQNEAVRLYMDAKVQQAVKYYYHRHQEHEVVKLKWSHVQGAFGALCLGYAISVVVFVLEITLHKI